MAVPLLHVMSRRLHCRRYERRAAKNGAPKRRVRLHRQASVLILRPFQALVLFRSPACGTPLVDPPEFHHRGSSLARKQPPPHRHNEPARPTVSFSQNHAIPLHSASTLLLRPRTRPLQRRHRSVPSPGVAHCHPPRSQLRPAQVRATHETGLPPFLLFGREGGRPVCCATGRSATGLSDGVESAAGGGVVSEKRVGRLVRGVADS